MSWLRRRMMANVGGDNPADSYIQNGLVFQLDGIEKGNDATKWIDRKNGIEWLNHNSTRLSNGWYFDGATSYLTSSGMGTYDISTCTLEFVFDAEVSNAMWFAFVDAGANLVFNYTYNYSGRNWLIIKGKSSGGSIGGASPLDESIIGAHIASMVAVPARAKVNVINGVQHINNNVNYSAAASAIIGARISASTNLPANFFKGTIYAIRIYNRLLTVEEMLANQVIDNERFALGLSI